MKKQTCFSIVLVALLVGGKIARAEMPTSKVYGDTLDRQTQTAYVRADVGWATYESGAVSNNATGVANTFEVGGAAGTSRTLAISFQSSQADIPFSVKSTSVSMSFNDVKLRYRIGYLYPTVAGTMTRVKISEDKIAQHDVFGSGGGGGLGVKMPITKEIMFEGEGLVFKTVESHDKMGGTTRMGDRMEGSGVVAFDLTPDLVDFMIGHRYRRYTMRIDERDTDEVQSSPFVGLRLGVYF